MLRPPNLSPSVRLWIRAGGLVAGAVIALGVAGIPLLGWTSRQYALLHDVRTRLAQAQEFQRSEASRAQALAQARREVEALQLHVSRGQGMASILDSLRADAERWHLQMNAAQSADHPPHTVQWGPHLSLQAMPITLTLVGRYRAIGEFLGGLSRAPFVAEVEHVFMKRHPDRYPQLEANVTVLIYGTTSSLTTP